MKGSNGLVLLIIYLIIWKFLSITICNKSNKFILTPLSIGNSIKDIISVIFGLYEVNKINKIIGDKNFIQLITLVFVFNSIVSILLKKIANVSCPNMFIIFLSTLWSYTRKHDSNSTHNTMLLAILLNLSKETFNNPNNIMSTLIGIYIGIISATIYEITFTS
jgi:hypothetical protein